MYVVNHKHMLTYVDYTEANVTVVNYYNTTGRRCNLPTRCGTDTTVSTSTYPNCYCKIVGGCKILPVPLPGYITPNKDSCVPGVPQVLNGTHCNNACKEAIGEVASPVPGGCRCTCPTCFSAAAPVNSTCTAIGCGPGGTTDPTTSRCVCFAGFQLAPNCGGCQGKFRYEQIY
jgi:hypothetical protein